MRRAVQRAARALPGSSCLAQTLAAMALLRAGGAPALVTIGVSTQAPDGGPGLDAHAWVHSGDTLVAGDGPIDRYSTLLTFGSRS